MQQNLSIKGVKVCKFFIERTGWGGGGEGVPSKIDGFLFLYSLKYLGRSRSSHI
jgi:hypothetical protein